MTNMFSKLYQCSSDNGFEVEIFTLYVWYNIKQNKVYIQEKNIAMKYIP